MDNQELKSLMAEIIDMNGGEFIYSPSISFYADCEPIATCFIQDSATGNRKAVQSTDTSLIEMIHTHTQKMIAKRAEYKRERKAELEKEMKLIEELEAIG